MDLASKIREHDPFADIIFFSMHADKLKLTFKYKLAALDFIVKEHVQLSEQVIEALQASFLKYQQLGNKDGTKFIQIKIGERIQNIPYDEIYYFETSHQEHKIILHAVNGLYEFYGKLKEFENIDKRFFRCHKSFLINLQYVQNINKEQRKITMTNNKVCCVSFRKMKDLQAKIVSVMIPDKL